MSPSRYLADALSLANLASGVAAIAAAARGRPDLSLLWLGLGVTFDAFDGAAARKFGSTPWGVYSDDVADGVTNGVAPGAAVALVMGGSEGLLLGVGFAIATFTRLVYFTARKGLDDPAWFRGLPSPAGAAMALSSLVVFPGSPLLIGASVAAASVLMVSFGARYVHVGRWIATSPRARWWGAVPVGGLLLSAGLGGLVGAASAVLIGIVVYALRPVLRDLVAAVGAPAVVT